MLFSTNVCAKAPQARAAARLAVAKNLFISPPWTAHGTISQLSRGSHSAAYTERTHESRGGNGQNHRFDFQRAFSHCRPARRQPDLPLADPRISFLGALGLIAPHRRQQLLPAGW